MQVNNRLIIISAVGCLQYAMLIQHKLGTLISALPIYAHNRDQESFHSLHYGEYTTGIPIEEGKSEHISPWHVSFCRTIHPAYGKVGGHMTAGEAGKLAERAGAKILVLTPHYGNHQELVKKAREAYAGEVVLAKAGWSRVL